MKKRAGHSPETRAKISATKRGKPRSPETRAKISSAKRGKTPTPETRAKMAAAKRGKAQTPETRAKIAAGRRKGETAGMTDAQHLDFKLFRRKGFSRAEAAALVWAESSKTR